MPKMESEGGFSASTKVLATKGYSKTPAVYAGVASAVAFMGPKRQRPPIFYFSSMMAAYAEALAAAGKGVEMLETDGEGHVFYLFKPDCDKAKEMLDRIVAFINAP